MKLWPMARGRNARELSRGSVGIQGNAISCRLGNDIYLQCW